MADDWDLEAVTQKWQEKWWEAGLHEANVEPDKPSYFIHFAYPGISGYLHVGHMRGFTYADVLGRYKRQTGHNVLFPAGFHASGIPAIAFAKDVERGEKTEYLRDNGYDGDIAALTDPRAVVDYFAHVYTHDYWKKFGYLIDDRRNCTTIDDGYKRFIQWQFQRLNDKGWLIQKPHYAPFCPVAGPVAVDKSETDIKQGGAAEVQEFVALRFRSELPDGTDVILPCATLRPETIYGVTNLWIHPETTYHVVRVWVDGAVGDADESELWVVSEQGKTKLLWQFERAEETGTTIAGKDLLGRTATAPFTGVEVPIVQGTFVDPMIATGIVMSVPGHAPFDWAAYVDAGLLESLGEPPKIVDIEGYDGLPARIACEAHGVKNQDDAEALAAATDQIYADEFNKGILRDNCGQFAGKRIKVVKDELRDEFVKQDYGRLIRQFSEVVISRAGELVDIKRIPDQDFIHYAEAKWTEIGKQHAQEMSIRPQRFQDELPNILDWFGDRACVRRGSWLGTEFPFKDGWIIEPIADSTFYPWFYVVSLYVNDGRLQVSELTDEFFDYVFNGKGDAKSALWDQVRNDVLYWGPVDVNLGGKEHQTVHFPVYIMTMCGLMDDPAMWPKGIFVNWWVTQKAGTKISKSKGGAEPIPGAAQKYGVDPMRLYYCHVGSPHVDIEWDPELVMTYKQHVNRLIRICDDVLAIQGESGPMDAWLQSTFAAITRDVLAAYDDQDLRAATSELVYKIPDVIRWYQRRGGENGELLATVVRDWATLLCPILPHVAEQMYENAGGEGLCSTRQMPEPAAVDDLVLAKEELVKSVLEDVQTVQRLAGTEAEAVTLYTSPAWKSKLAKRALELAESTDGKFPMGQLMQEVMADPENRARGKAVQAFCGKLPAWTKQLAPSHKQLVLADVDEAEAIAEASSFLAATMGVAQVTVFAADDESAPQHAKQNLAGPLKPGIAWLDGN